MPGAAIEKRPVSQVFAKNLREFAGLTETLDLNNDLEFQDMLFNAVTHYSVAPADIAEQLKTTKGTISKWVNGKAFPHPMMRPVIADWLAKQAYALAERIENGEELFDEAV